MGQPSPERQIGFLINLQRLLNEGSFVATYKFALLSAPADLCVERGADTDAILEIRTREIAEKFVTYYWRQSRPFLSRWKKGSDLILRQNTGREAGVIRLLRFQVEAGVNSLAALKRDRRSWNSLINKTNRIVCDMPLWKLQTVGGSTLEFLYPNAMCGDSIRLKPGVMFCFRIFHTFITDMVRGAWIRYVRRYNRDQLGHPTDLDEFLFGSERVPLTSFVPILRDLQSACCFYCGTEIRRNEDHVDHFIPWVTYPVNLGHNFVLCDSRCNNAKSDHLAAFGHLEHWNLRNKDFGLHLSAEFDRISAVHDINASQTIAARAYNRASAASAETFLSRGMFERLPADWRVRVRWS